MPGKNNGPASAWMGNANRHGRRICLPPGSVAIVQLPHWLILILCAVLTLSGCTRSLPGYAAPKIAVVDVDLDMADVIGYRKLERADFKAGEPPTDFDERMAAVTCVHTQPIVDGSAIDIQPATTVNGQLVYDVTYNNLKYRALMNRDCSWWNPDTSAGKEDYVLEHEQIHFALFEIAAREWSELPPLRFRVRAGSNDDMKREIQAQFEDLLQRRLEGLLERNRQFDEETSLGHNPEKQSQWLDLVRSRLSADSAPGLASP